jgi:hypothetical protein
MFKRLLACTPALAFFALAGTATPASATPAVAQEERRQEERRRDDRRDDRRQDDRRDRRDDRGGVIVEERRSGVVQEERRVDDRARSDDRGAPHEFRAKNVLGTKVSIQGDISIGTVDDIVFSDEGYVEYLIVNNDNQLRTIPWQAAKFNFERRTATVNITQTQWQTVPTYTPGRYPTFFAPTYRQETYRFFGLTPREIRRMDRR